MAISQSTKADIQQLLNEYSEKLIKFTVKYEGEGTAERERKELMAVKAELETRIENL